MSTQEVIVSQTTATLAEAAPMAKKARKQRSDKGVKRGPRKAKADNKIPRDSLLKS